MSGETGALQKLTDEQIRTRLAAYNPDGSMDRDVELLREHCTDIIAEEIVAQFGPERAARYAETHSGKVNAAWVQSGPNAMRKPTPGRSTPRGSSRSRNMAARSIATAPPSRSTSPRACRPPRGFPRRWSTSSRTISACSRSASWPSCA